MSFEVNHVLVNIPQFMKNEVDGFHQCLRKCRHNTEEMKIFISQCQSLIENGCIKVIDGVSDEVSFFATILNKLFIKPAKNAFQHQESFSSNDREVVKYLAKICLFRLLLDVHKDNPCVKNGSIWFAQVKSNLDEEFKNICDSSLMPTVRYNGKMIGSMKELQDVIDEKRNIYINNKPNYNEKFNTILVIVAITLFVYINNVLNADMPGSRNAAFVFGCGILFYKMHILNQAKMRKEAKHSLASLALYKSEYQKNKKILSDENIKKFFFVSDEEIEALKNNEGSQEMLLTEGMRNRRK